jgi:hypothetical protein
VGFREIIPQSAVETFQVAVLHGPSWLEVDDLNLPLLAPAQEMPTGQFRAVVAANRFWLSPPTFDHTFERSRNPTARQAGIDF